MTSFTKILDDRIVTVGTSGSGKTYAMKVLAEKLLATGARVCIVDPLGVWWGLRSNARGDGPGMKVVVIGGDHGDVPLTEYAGAVIAETVATTDMASVIDLSQLGSQAARRRFMAAFAEALYDRNREPLHLILDEADLWAPQRPFPEALTLLNRIDEIVRRGRVRGFIPWLITQRPAVLHKDVLSQADTLIAMKLTSSQDRDALKAWIEGQADRAQEREIIAALPSLKTGEGFLWSPGHGILERVKFPAISTFDSSRTPKRGERIATPTGRAAVDLDAFRARLSTVEAEVKQKDPVHLRRRIVELERENATLKARAPDPEQIRATAAEAYRNGGIAATAWAKNAIADTVADLMALADKMRKRMPATNAETPQSTEKYSRPQQSQESATVSRGGGAELRILKVLAQRHSTRLTKSQWATLAGMKKSGGTWSTYLSRLRTSEYVDQQGGLFGVTSAGLAACGTVPAQPQTPDAVIAMWRDALGGGAARMFDALVAAYPDGLGRSELADRLEMAVNGGTFSTYLSRLRSNGLAIVAGGRITASDTLFGVVK